jgi:hypothetical protein
MLNSKDKLICNGYKEKGKFSINNIMDKYFS